MNVSPRGASVSLGGIKDIFRQHAAMTTLSCSVGAAGSPPPPRTALLIRDMSDSASASREKIVADMLETQGFEVTALSGAEEAAQLFAGLSAEARTLTVLFDLSGRRADLSACEGAGLAGMYSFKQATGMFKKVIIRGRDVSLCAVCGGENGQTYMKSSCDCCDICDCAFCKHIAIFARM